MACKLRLVIVIPAYNRRHFTSCCLERLRRQTSREFQTVVVDDGSTDGTAQMIRERFPEVRLIEGYGNLWWSGAVNEGIRYALTMPEITAVMTLNDDTLPDDDFVACQLRAHDANPAAILGAFELEQKTGKPHSAGERIHWLTGRDTNLVEELREPFHGLQPATHVAGRGMLVPISVFRTVGLFDARRLPQRAADNDLCHAARRAGFRVYCNLESRLYTYPEACGGTVFRRNPSLRNYWRHLFDHRGDANLIHFTVYMWKNCPPLYLATALGFGYARRLFGYWIHALKAAPMGKPAV